MLDNLPIVLKLLTVDSNDDMYDKCLRLYKYFNSSLIFAFFSAAFRSPKYLFLHKTVRFDMTSVSLA